MLHRDNLLNCDAVLVYYGAAPKAWVDIKLREVLNEAAIGETGRIATPGGLHRDLRTITAKSGTDHFRLAVIRQIESFALSPDLNAFIGIVKEACP